MARLNAQQAASFPTGGGRNSFYHYKMTEIQQ